MTSGVEKPLIPLPCQDNELQLSTTSRGIIDCLSGRSLHYGWRQKLHCIALHCTYPLHLISNAIRVHTAFTGPRSGISSLVLTQWFMRLFGDALSIAFLIECITIIIIFDGFINIIAGY